MRGSRIFTVSDTPQTAPLEPTTTTATESDAKKDKSAAATQSSENDRDAAPRASAIVRYSLQGGIPLVGLGLFVIAIGWRRRLTTKRN